MLARFSLDTGPGRSTRLLYPPEGSQHKGPVFTIRRGSQGKCVRNNGLLNNKVVRSLVLAIIAMAAAVSVAHAQTAVTVAWDANTDPYTAGYRVYYGTAPGSYQWSVDAGTRTSGPLTLSPGYIYYFAVRAYNSAYEYGPPSNEATVDLRSTTAPAPTAQITASLSGTTALVSWQTANAVSASINGIAVGSSGSASVTVNATTTFTIVAVAADGRTATASATVTVTSTPTPPPAPPAALSSSTAGSRVTLSWSPPASGGRPDRYLIYVGTSAGGSELSNGYVVGDVLTVTGELPRGRYYARVRAANAAGMSGDSNEVQFRIGRQLRTPGGFQVTWEGSVAVFSWSPWVAADAPREDEPTGYVLEAGTRPGASDVATINVGNVTSFRATVPGGRFYVRLRAVNALGNSDPTPDLVVSPPGAPGAPTSLADVGSGQTVDLRWSAPVGGGPPTGYVIEAGSAPGLSNLVVLPVGNITRFVTSAPPGLYYVRVRAVNAQGPGEASNEIVVRR